jgi:hypothetical protein
MKKALLLLLVLTSVISYSQRSKTVKIIDNTGNHINAVYTFDDNGNPKDTLILWFAQEYRYTATFELISIHKGIPISFYDFICKLEEFCKKETEDVTDHINGQRVSWYKMYGAVGIDIYGTDEDSSGYTTFKPKQITKMRLAFEQWATKNNVKLKL